MQETIDLDTSKCFFHYTTRDAAFGDIVPRRRLRFSSYGRMCDPLENQPWQWIGEWSVSPQHDPRLGENKFMDFNRRARDVFRLAQLLALTKDADNYGAEAADFAKGWARARMWEQYSENHGGVCLVFDKERLTELLVRDVAKQLGHPPYHGAVEYSERGSRAYLNLHVDDLPETVEPEYVNTFIEANKGPLFFEKVIDWQSEHEYRFVTTAPPEVPLYAEIGDALVGVVAGERFPDWQRPAAIKAAHEIDVNPAELNWRAGVPRLVPFVPYTPEERDVIERNHAGLGSPPSEPTG
jgi:hypothetical protein